jgi:hypothetical protein
MAFLTLALGGRHDTLRIRSHAPHIGRSGHPDDRIMTAPELLPAVVRTLSAGLASTARHVGTHQSANRPNPATDRNKGLRIGAVDAPSVACFFCREPIELSSFTSGGRFNRTASCVNCGLLVSVAEQVWVLWSQANATMDVERSLAERLRARRVATAARAILDRVAETPDPADEPSSNCDAVGIHPAGLTPGSRTGRDMSRSSSSTPGRRHHD